MNVNNNNNAPSGARSTGKRRRNTATPALQAQPPQKKQKTQPSKQARKRRERMGRAAADFALTGRGGTRNRTTNRKSFVIEEDEYIAEVTPSNQPGFAVVQYSVNPGQAGCFPWLSTIARNFEKYEFEYLEFVYKREVSEFATNGVSGKVIYQFDTDAADPAPIGKQVMEATEPHNDGLPSENFSLKIPRPMLQPIKTDAHYVRPGALPANTDIKTYDVGNLNVGTYGTAANTVTGELHVRYRVKLSIPVLPPGGPVNVGTLQAAGGTIGAATPFGLAPVATGSLVLTTASPPTAVMTITNVQVGQEVLISHTIQGVGLTACTASAASGMTHVGTYASNCLNAGTSDGAYVATYLVTAMNPTITFADTTGTSITASQTVVTVLAPVPAF